MKYRSFPKLPNLELSQFGMGLMRLPVSNEETREIDREKTIQMVDAAIAGGVNYFDTAHPYHNGDSQKFAAEHIVPKLKSKNLHLATKLPQWMVKSYDDYEKLLDEQLEILKLDQIEFYLLHALNDATWENHLKWGLLDFLDKAKSDGRIKHSSFSYHGSVDTYKKIIDEYDGWMFSQIQLNYIDQNWQAGIEGMKYAHSKDVGIVIMEPLKGGILANQLSDDAKKKFSENGLDPVETAMRWCYNFDEPTVVLSGVSTLDQTLDQISIAKNAAPNCLSEAEKNTAEYVRDSFALVPCSGCEYCQPCPTGVGIPMMLSIYNDYFVFNKQEVKQQYKFFVERKIDAGLCVECGQCEQICPQSIDIMARLKELHETMTK